MGFPFAKIAAKNIVSKPSTVKFPAVPVEAKKGYRGRISYDAEKCVNCGMCIKVCSPQAITRTAEPADGGENITYVFDLTSCTFCGTCEDFCSTKAIHLTEDYHMVATDPKDLLVTGTRFKEAVGGYPECGDACVFCTLCAKVCPEGAIEVDRAAKSWKLNQEECVQCGICSQKCPKKCITMTGAEHGDEAAEESEKTGAEKAGKADETTVADEAAKAGEAPKADEAAKADEAPKVDEAVKEDEAAKAGEAPKADEAGGGYPEYGDACVFCTLCAKVCPAGAIEVDRDAKSWKLDKDICLQCGFCVEKCPKKCITMTGI